MLNAPRDHSAILMTSIKLPFVFKTFLCLFLSGCLRQVLLYCLTRSLTIPKVKSRNFEVLGTRGFVSNY